MAKAKRGRSIEDGFKKKVTTGRRPPRWTYHKRRTTWFAARTAWPLREAPVNQLVLRRAQARATIPAAAGAGAWQLVGPSNVGGRTTCVACHPTKPDLIWAGAAAGGVWHSTDGGATWAPQWHNQDSLDVGSIAIDPASPDTIYCGTGEANLSLDSYPGIGLFRTVDGGATWALLASSAKAGIPTRIGVIAVDPFDSRHVVLGGVGHQPQDDDPSSFGGMWSSRDGGTTFRRETFISTDNYWCHSIVFDPTTAGRIYAAVTERGAKNGIWRTEDGGKTWLHLTKGLPSPDKMERTVLAIAPSNPSVIYAQVSSDTDHVLGVYRSADGGQSWKDVGGAHFRQEGQMNYGNAIAVHPTNPNRVICGGVDLHLTTDGGKTWSKVTRWDAKRGTSKYAHADHHALLMPAARPGRIYDVNDGGMDVSEDGGTTWRNRSNGLATTMFYDLDVAPSNAAVFGGGCQDNGTNITRTGKADAFVEIDGGDGGWMVFDPKTTDHLFASVYNVQVHRFRAATGWTDVSPPEVNPDAFWMVYLDIDYANPTTILVGTSRVWRSKNDGDAWKDVSGVLDGSAISAIDIARASSKRIYVGTENGGFFRSLDGGDTWSGNLASATIPGLAITRIESHPTKPDIVYVTVGNFGPSHVFRSADGGRTWASIDRGKLPAVPFHAVVVPTAAPRTVYVAGDAGVFMSPDEGASWKDVTGNLPNVRFVDLVFHDASKTLTVATYGRSLWRLSVPG
jgi:photosystem II stability/assembly factor-like uncharacterized protein